MSQLLGKHNADLAPKPLSRGFLERRLRAAFVNYYLLVETFNEQVTKNERYPNSRELQLAANERASVRIKLQEADIFIDLLKSQGSPSAHTYFELQGLPWFSNLSDEFAPVDNDCKKRSSLSPRRSIGEPDRRELDGIGSSQEIPKTQSCEPDPETLNELRKRDAEKRIRSYIQAYLNLHGALPKLATICQNLRCSKNTAKPVLVSIRGDVPPAQDLLVVCDRRTYSTTKKSKHVASERFTDEDMRTIDNCFSVIRELVEASGKWCFLVTLNVPSTGNGAEKTVARSAKEIVRSFTSSMIDAFSVLHHLSGWERQPRYRNRLHLHTLFVVERNAALPTHAELTSLWSAVLPPDAFIGDSGEICELKPVDVDIRWHLDFSNSDNHKHCYLAKIKSKKARYINGVPSLPKCWWHANPELIRSANCAIITHEIGVLREHHAFKVISDLIAAVAPQDWQETSNRKAVPYRKVTGYQARFPAHQVPEITADISSFADEVASRPYVLKKNAARIFALVTINPSGLVTVTTRRQEASLNVRQLSAKVSRYG